MRAILVDEPGGPEQLTIGQAPEPEIGPDDLLVEVHATALNRADLMQRAGKYPPPDGVTEILGLEAAGRVAAVGENVEQWEVGDRVMGLLPGGGYAEYVKMDAGMALPIPASLSFIEGAAIPETFLTAYQALVWLGETEPGDHVLVHAGASGVGTAALQIARELGAHPYATVSAPKVERARAIGAEEAVDYEAESFDEVILQETDGHGADVIVDFIGAPYLEPNLNALALDGRIVLLATLGGYRAEEFDLRQLFRKRGTLRASTLRNRSADYKRRLAGDVERDLLPLFAEGSIEPVIDRIYEWEDVAEAHRHMEANRNVGKIVLQVRRSEDA